MISHVEIDLTEQNRFEDLEPGDLFCWDEPHLDTHRVFLKTNDHSIVNVENGQVCPDNWCRLHSPNINTARVSYLGRIKGVKA